MLGPDKDNSERWHVLPRLNTRAILNPDVIWRAAVKLAYDGRAFMGSQRQPGERTVESETIRALKSIGAIESVAGSHLRFASRTDRGVSALGNVAAFTTSFPQGPLLQALNAAADDVYFHAVARVPESFSPRRAKGRWYRYLLPDDGLDLARVQECASVLGGRHDFARFCKADGRSTVKTLEVTVFPVGEFVVIDLRAREFLRNMVRRLVAAMSEVGKGRVEVGEVQAALAGKDVSFGLAPAEYLTLMDIDYGFEFQEECPATMARRVSAYRRDAFCRLAFADMLQAGCGENPRSNVHP